MAVRELRKGDALIARARHARSFWSRGWGLLGRRSLDSAEGLLLDPCGSVHTSFMRFPIDVVYLDRDWKVVKVVAALRPWRLSAGGRSARRTLELAAGEAARCELREGDRLDIK